LRLAPIPLLAEMTLANLSLVASLPGVKSAVLGDNRGGFLEAFRENDAETVAAVTGFMTSALHPIGEELSLGGLTRVSSTGPSRAWLVAVFAEAALSIAVEPPSALSSVERALASQPPR
jgi:hypothetical protein